MRVFNYILFVLCCIAFTQCFEYADGADYTDIEETTLYMDGLLKDGCHPEIQFSTAVSILSSDNPEMLNAEDISVRITETDNVYPLYYDAAKEIFTSQALIIQKDKNYTVEADPIRDDLSNSVTANTRVPVPMAFSDIVIDDFSREVIGIDTLEYIYDVSLYLDHNSDIGDYYLIEPISRYIIRDGNSQLQYESRFDPYSIIQVFTNSNALKLVNGSHAMILDNTKGIVHDKVSMRISLDDKFNRRNQGHLHAYFRLYNISEDYYLYLKSGGQHNQFGTTWFVEPVIEHSNVAGGKGVLGGASVKLDSVYVW